MKISDVIEKKSNTNNRYLLEQHPCLSKEAHYKKGRIHLPVSPSCNIQCNFCKRGFNKLERRPGVCNSLLVPDKAIKIVERALEICHDITVVGIAGPGDTLATNHALDAFELINKEFPHLINCLSTNGLMIEKKAERIINTGVKMVTITINSVEPKIQQNICSYILHNGEYITGEKAGHILISAQLNGINILAKNGVFVKVNTVLIPGVNDHHISEIARITSSAGASIINIIPLIPQNKMIKLEAPDCKQLNDARKAAEEYLQVFRHCKHCRADACGIPGSEKDLSELLYQQSAGTFSHG